MISSRWATESYYFVRTTPNIYEENNQYVSVRLDRQAAFKSSTVWYVRAGKGLRETFLEPNQTLKLANNVCHRKERPTVGGGTAIRVRCSIVHNSVPVTGLLHFEATAVQFTFAGRPVKTLAAYLSPTRRLFVADLTACFGGAGPDGQRSQCKTRGLELAADHETRETST